MKLLLCLAAFGTMGLVWGCQPPPRAPNLARKGSATQISTFPPDASADKAIDGKRDPDYSHKSCSQTNNEPSPWWRLDLKRTYKVSVVVVTNGNRNPELLLGAQIRVGDSPNNNNDVCANITDTSRNPISICCNERAGRYLSVGIPGRSATLTLCEVQVYGRLARKKTC
ncbi:fucolectin-1-like [Xenopus tropicalis]|uniref:Fucolectin-1-like n=1 Tax=Xenopus tropicalis TaxID=8364 RepID=A0A803JJI1_XENTR|nr:fucolectin-1-like [Xenopus tropicalis]